MANVTEEHRHYSIRRAQLRQMTVRWNYLHNGLASQVLVQVLGNHHRHGQVLDALKNVAGDRDMAQNLPQIDLEYGLSHAQSYVRPHVEQSPTEFLNRHRVHVAADRQRSETRAPRLVVRFHSFE